MTVTYDGEIVLVFLENYQMWLLLLHLLPECWNNNFISEFYECRWNHVTTLNFRSDALSGFPGYTPGVLEQMVIMLWKVYILNLNRWLIRHFPVMWQSQNMFITVLPRVGAHNTADIWVNCQFTTVNYRDAMRLNEIKRKKRGEKQIMGRWGNVCLTFWPGCRSTLVQTGK